MRNSEHSIFKAAVFTAAFFVFVTSASGADRRYLKKQEVFCDTSRVLCLDGSLTYRFNSRILTLNARIQKTVPAGRITLGFVGSNRHELPRYTEIVLLIRGKYSEIVDTSMRPDDPDVSDWQLASFSYTPNSQ